MILSSSGKQLVFRLALVFFQFRIFYFFLQAEKCFEESLALCPDYPDAIKWKEKLNNVQVSETLEPWPRIEHSRLSLNGGIIRLATGGEGL